MGLYSIHFDADPDPVPDLAYHFDADPDFYLMRMRIQVTKMVRIHADPDPQHCLPERCSVLQSYGGSWVIEHEQ
jgi:hypothetical protein